MTTIIFHDLPFITGLPAGFNLGLLLVGPKTAGPSVRFCNLSIFWVGLEGIQVIASWARTQRAGAKSRTHAHALTNAPAHSSTRTKSQ